LADTGSVTSSFPARIIQRILASVASLGVLVAVTVGCLWLKENYPFSHFPMYDKFSDETLYVFVSDRDRNPVALQKVTLHRTGRLKKQYEGNGLLKTAKAARTSKRKLAAELKRPLAEPVLEWLWDNTWEEGRAQLRDRLPLHLEEVWILLEDGEIVETEPEVIATFMPRTPDQP